MIKKRFPPENLSLRKYFRDLINQFMKPASNEMVLVFYMNVYAFYMNSILKRSVRVVLVYSLFVLDCADIIATQIFSIG